MKKTDILMKEYELCQASTQYLDSLIWKTSAGMGFGKDIAYNLTNMRITTECLEQLKKLQ